MNFDRFVAIDIIDLPTAKRIYDIVMLLESLIWNFFLINMVFLRELTIEQEKTYNFNLDCVKTEFILSWNPFWFVL